MKNHSTAGFSLMEMAIVLIILGVIGSLAMPSLVRHRHSAAVALTRQKQDDILHAVTSFALLNNRLPCPADPSLRGIEYGKERQSCVSADSAVGIVPFKALGLSADMSRDGFGRPMTFAVPQFEPTIADPICKMIVPAPENLKVLNEHHQNVADSLSEDEFVAVLLISYGQSGQGAFVKQSSRRQESYDVSAFEAKNADNTRTFYDCAYSTNPEAPFRHIVRWVTARNLMALYAKTPCQPSQSFAGEPRVGQDTADDSNPFN